MPAFQKSPPYREVLKKITFLMTVFTKYLHVDLRKNRGNNSLLSKKIGYVWTGLVLVWTILSRCKNLLILSYKELCHIKKMLWTLNWWCVFLVLSLLKARFNVLASVQL